MQVSTEVQIILVGVYLFFKSFVKNNKKSTEYELTTQVGKSFTWYNV